MALGGDLKNIKLADIFQTLSMNRQVGTLVVVSDGTRKKVFFSDRGVSLVSERSISAFRLGQYLCGIGKITAEDLRVALTRQHETGRFLGETLVELGLCQDEDVEEVVRYHAAEELYEIFSWDQGSFEFREGDRSEEDAEASPYSDIAFDPGGLVMEAARRIDEWELIRDTIPSEDDFHLRTGNEGDRLDPGVWGYNLAGVYALVDGIRSVGDIYSQHHLSKFDTGTVLLKLLGEGLIRPFTFEELLSSSSAFLSRKDSDKGTQCLERAHELKPTDVDTIVKLADCYERLDEKKAAARLLQTLGELYLGSDETAEAVNALEKSEKYDPGAVAAPTLLFRIYLDLGDTAAAAEKARSAADLLCEQDFFEQAASLCNEVLAEMPDHTALRITRANALLGMGLKDAALEELEEIATALEEARSYRILPEIYRKILQLDSSRREYLHRLEDLQEGKIRRKQTFVRVATGAGAAALLALLLLILLSGGESADDSLNQAWEFFQRGNLIEAKRLTIEVLDGRDPDSDAAMRAQNLLVAIWGEEEKSTGPTATALTELKLRLQGFTVPANSLIKDGKYGDGLEQLWGLVEHLGSEEYRDSTKALPTKEVNSYRKKAIDEAGRLLEAYSEHLKSLVEKQGERLSKFEELRLDEEDLSEVEQICNVASDIRDATTGTERVRNIEVAENIEAELRPRDDGKLRKALQKTSGELTELNLRAETLYHRARALIRGDEVLTAFKNTTMMLSDLLEIDGELEKARVVCRRYLAMCEQLAAETPEDIYGPVIESLLSEEGLNLDGQIQAKLGRIQKILGTIEGAEESFREGEVGKANDRLRELLGPLLRFNLARLVELGVLIRTRPAGATVTLTWHNEDPVVLGTTAAEGILARYPPLGETVIRIEKDTFIPVEMRIKDFTDLHDPAPIFDLMKESTWNRDSGGPVQATPIPAGEVVLVASRDGHLRGLSIEDGSILFDHDTGLIGGFQCSPVLSGNLAFLSAIDGKLLAFDLDKWEEAWSFPTDAALRTEAVLAEDRLVVADEAGMTYGIDVKEGREIWRLQLDGRVVGDPVAHGGSVYLGTTEGTVYRLAALQGRVVWSKNLGSPIRSALAHDGNGRVVVGTEDARVLALSEEDGGVLWTRPVDEPSRGRPVIQAGYVYLATTGGTIYRIAVADGKPLPSYTLPGGHSIPGGLTLGEGCVYVVDETGTLYSVCLSTVEFQWKYDLGGKDPPAPLVHEGQIFAATDQGDVYCFRQ